MKRLTVFAILLVCVASAVDIVPVETIMRIDTFPRRYWDFEEWDTDSVGILKPRGWHRESGYPERVSLPYHGRYGIRGISSTIWTDKIDLYYPGDSAFRCYLWTLNRHVLGKIECGTMRLDFYFMGQYKYTRDMSIWSGEYDKWVQQGWLYWFDIGKLYPIDQVRVTFNVACSLYYDCGIFEVLYSQEVGVGEGRRDGLVDAGRCAVRPLRFTTSHGVFTRFRGEWYDILGRKVNASSIGWRK